MEIPLGGSLGVSARSRGLMAEYEGLCPKFLGPH